MCSVRVRLPRVLKDGLGKRPELLREKIMARCRSRQFAIRELTGAHILP